MSPRVSIWPRAALLLLLVLASLPRGRTQEGVQGSPEVRATIEGRGFTRISIALPDPAGPGAPQAARELIETVRADLVFSGFFDVVDPSLYRLVATSPAPSAPPASRTTPGGRSGPTPSS